MRKYIVLLFGTGLLCAAGIWTWKQPNTFAINTAHATMTDQLNTRNLSKGMPVFIRIFKSESILELWLKAPSGWKKYADFPVCAWSGKLGPKLKEGDRQSPEGFYHVQKAALNPNSKYHLSFNIGFPNAYDRQKGHTGSYLMVHGNCVSIGCYAMTDGGIESIYALVEAALKSGQSHVPVHIYPFRMTAQNMEAHQDSNWITFWQNLKTAHDYFETHQSLPQISAINGTYIIDKP